MVWLLALPDEDRPALVPYDDREPYNDSFVDMDEMTASEVSEELGDLQNPLGPIDGPPDVGQAARRMLDNAVEAIERDRSAARAGHADEAQDGADAEVHGEGVNGEATVNENTEEAADENEDAEDVEEAEAVEEVEEGEADDEDDYGEYEDFEGGDDDDAADRAEPKKLSRPWVPVHLPAIALVNREARQIVLDYIDGKGWAILRNNIYESELQDGFWHEEPVFARRYDPERDALWVDRIHWPVFMDHMLESDRDEGADVVTLAVPAFTAYHSIMTLGELFHVMPNLKRVVSIWGDLPPDDWVPEQVNAKEVICHKLHNSTGDNYEDEDNNDEVQLVVWQRWDAAKVRDVDAVPEVTDEEEKKEVKEVEEQDLDESEWPEEEDEDEEAQRQMTVAMVARDPMNGKELVEKGPLGMYLEEIYAVLKVLALPSRMFEGQMGDTPLPFLARRAVYRV